MNLSLKLLGSEELRIQLLKDINYLIDMARAKKLKPVILVVGIIFVEVSIMRLLKDIISEKVMDEELINNYNIISELFKVKKLSCYNEYEIKSGDFSTKEEKRFKVFFDPEEEYLRLVVISPTEDGTDADIKSADNHPFYHLKFKPDEILDSFCDKFFN